MFLVACSKSCKLGGDEAFKLVDEKFFERGKERLLEEVGETLLS